MSKLEKLVPPLELCKQIPAGEFEDSALVWNTTVCDEDDGEIVGVHERDDCDSWMHINQIPAPTLAEILEALENHGSVFTRRDDDGWMVMLEIAGDDEGYGYDAKIERDTASPATAALRLWLGVNK